MIITPLGHTEFLVDIENHEGKNIRILVDGWFSDYAIGDLMERTVKVRFDHGKLSTIDAMYISHAHCDHFDPYTLVEIFGSPFSGEEGGHHKPLLILPFTLRYLEPLLSKYLPQTVIHWLGNRETYTLMGIEITGYMWQNPVITNEDDVMMLAISSERELVFAEIDTVPDMEDEEVQKSLYKVFTRKNYETACYLASRNCLEGQIPYYDILPEKRKPYRDHYIASQKEEIAFQYERFEYDEFAHHPNLFALPGFVRGFIGQGIAYPSSMSEELYNLALFPLDEIVSIESDYGNNAGYSFPQKALIPGRQYKFENGNIEAGRKECSIGELVVDRKSGIENRDVVSVISSEGDSRSREISHAGVQDLSTSLVPRFGRDDTNERIFASGPLIPRELSEIEITEGKKKILEILNTRFLPYWSASPVASLRDVLIKNNGVYRMSFFLSSRRDPFQNHVGEKNKHNLLSERKSDSCVPLRNDKMDNAILFEYSTSRSSFVEVPYEEGMHTDEDYGLLDILDFLDGKLEMYSSFWHLLDPKKVYRLWTCLGANFMNHDLVEKKYRYHFERAKAGNTATEFVEGILKNL